MTWDGKCGQVVDRGPGTFFSLVWPGTIVQSFLPSGDNNDTPNKWSLQWLNKQATAVGCAIKMRSREDPSLMFSGKVLSAELSCALCL